jgi:DNA-binding response OmpR family regulator
MEDSMVVLLISQAQSLRKLLKQNYRGRNGIKILVASSYKTVEDALKNSPPDLLIVDSSHPEAIMLAIAAQALVSKLQILALAGPYV